ncbi:MAG: rbn [Herminiimonas sp.]|nr:rbn [Herminiimonas sp.]
MHFFSAQDNASPRSHTSNLVRFAIGRLNQERLPQVAGSLTFTTVLALVPVLTIALAVFTTFPLFTTFRQSVESYFFRSLMPTGIANTILSYLNQFAAQATRLSAVGAVALVVTAITTMAMVDRTFNQIWRVKSRRPLAQRILVYWGLITLGPLLIGVSLSVTSYLFTATSDVVGHIPMAGAMFYTTVSLVLTGGAFTLLYVIVPNRLVDWRDAAVGGVFAAIAFELSKRLFAVFVAKFHTYTILYGALAAVPIFLVWVYLGWLITLSGAVVSAVLPVFKSERWWHVPAPGSEFIDAMALLALLVRARSEGASAIVDGHAIRVLTRLGIEESESLLEQMLEAGWVARIRPDTPRRAQFGKRITEGLDRWVLVANPDTLTLGHVYRLFVFSADANSAVARLVDDAVGQGLRESLTHYFEDPSTQPRAAA